MCARTSPICSSALRAYSACRRGFDPANGCLVDLDHIRVAAGRNYRDATPTAGTLYAGGQGERLDVSVCVKQIDEARPAEAQAPQDLQQ